MRRALSTKVVAAIAASASAWLTPSTEASFVPYGFQSGKFGTAEETSLFNDDSYAGAARYDPSEHRLYVTGITYNTYFDDPRDSGGGGRRLDDKQPPQSIPTVGEHLTRADCFLAVFELPRVGEKDVDGQFSSNEYKTAPPKLLYKRRYGARNIPDSCSTIDLLKPLNLTSQLENSRRIIVGGHTEENGYLTDIRYQGSDRATVYGFVADMALVETFDPTESGFVTNGGRLLHDEIVQYPVALAVAPYTATAGGDAKHATSENTEAVYVASLFSEDNDVNQQFNYEDGMDDFILRQRPDITAGGGGGNQQFGTSFAIKLERLTLKNIASDTPPAQVSVERDPLEDLEETTMNSSWKREFAPANGKSVRVAGMVYLPQDDGADDDILLLAGETKGYGMAFGGANDAQSGSSDYDGFITKVLAKTGDMPKDDGKGTHTYRISSQPGQNEYVRGICVSPPTSAVGVHVFVVGSTMGILGETEANSTQAMTPQERAFLIKFSISKTDLTPVWLHEIGTVGGAGDVEGVSCTVTPDGEVVYIGGVVHDGATLPESGSEDDSQATTSFGKDDIFVASYDSRVGTVNYVRQIGTSEDDMIARGSGGLSVDGDGNLIVVGSTRGSLMRQKDPSVESAVDDDAADVFFVSVERESGDFLPTVQQRGSEYFDDESPSPPTPTPPKPSKPVVSSDKPTPTPTTPTASKDNSDVSPPTGGEALASANTDNVDNDEGTDKMSAGGVFFVIILVLMFVAALSALAYRVGTKRAQDRFGAITSNEQVAQYLKDFDDMDIEIRHSASGGWHGMYNFQNGVLVGSGLGGGVKLGPNRYVPEEVTVTLSSHGSSMESSRSIVQEALFMSDEDDLGSVRRPGDQGRGFNGSNRGQRGDDDDDDDDDDEDDGNSQSGMDSLLDGGREKRGYEGLIESYNISWADRTKQLSPTTTPSSQQIRSMSSKQQDALIMPGMSSRDAAARRAQKTIDDYLDDTELI